MAIIDNFSIRIVGMIVWLFASLAVIIVFGILAAIEFHVSYAICVAFGFVSLVWWFKLGKKLAYN